MPRTLYAGQKKRKRKPLPCWETRVRGYLSRGGLRGWCVMPHQWVTAGDPAERRCARCGEKLPQYLVTNPRAVPACEGCAREVRSASRPSAP